MRATWRDVVSTMLVVVGAFFFFAKLASYSWWFIGSWKGSVALLSVLGLVMLAIYAEDFTNARNWFNWTEGALWIAAIVLAIIGLSVASQGVFIALGSVLAATWLVTLGRHIWHSTYDTRTHGTGSPMAQSHM